MRLSALLSSLSPELAPREWLRPDPSDDPVIRGITYDSRRRRGRRPVLRAAWVAEVDGHDYLEPRPSSLGAAARDRERDPSGWPRPARSVRSVVVPRQHVSALAPRGPRVSTANPSNGADADRRHGNQRQDQYVSYLMESILGVRGAAGGPHRHRRNPVRRASGSPPSTPRPRACDLQRTLRAMRTQERRGHAVMEVSSHGLELGRVGGCRFAVAAFTNLTQDHLDFHGNMDSYLQSKALLFRSYLAMGGAAVLNVDDPSYVALRAAAAESDARVIRTTRDPEREAEVRIVEAETGISGSRVVAALPSGEIELELPLVGDFNLENLVVSLGICEALGIEREDIRAGVAACPQVPGRMEVIGAERDDAPTVIVDYAHTPDAVDKLLGAVRPLSRGRVITVFGCGGDRDRAKRPLMAEAVARHSDRIPAQRPFHLYVLCQIPFVGRRRQAHGL